MGERFDNFRDFFVDRYDDFCDFFHISLDSDEVIAKSVSFVVTSLVVWGLCGNQIKGIVNDISAIGPKKGLENVVVQSLQEKGYSSIVNVEVEHFDWMNKDDDCFFKFTGNALTTDNKKIEFFSTKYKVDEQQYNETSKYLNERDTKKLETKYILNKVAETIKSSELIEANFIEKVETQCVESSSEVQAIDKPIILEVTKPVVGESDISYNVCYTQPVRANNKVGLITTKAQVCFDKTEDLMDNPSKIFALDKSNSKVNVIDRDFFQLKQLEIQEIQTPER